MGGSGGGGRAAPPAAPAGCRPQQQPAGTRGTSCPDVVLTERMADRSPLRHGSFGHLTPAFRTLPCRSFFAHPPATAPGSPLRSTRPQDSEGLLPEEDAEIPGSYRDAMSTKTPLGKAVAGACDELDALGSLVRLRQSVVLAWASLLS